jgi:hypothetical protein
MKGAFQMLDGEKQLYSWRKPFIVHLTLLFFISFIFFADQMLELIDSEKNNMILKFSAKWNNFRGEHIFSNYFDHDQKLEIIIFRR